MLTAEGRAAENFLMGLILLVTDSIFHARKYIFKNGRKKKEQKKGIPPFPLHLRHIVFSRSKKKKKTNPLQKLFVGAWLHRSRRNPRATSGCPLPRLPAQEPLLSSEKAQRGHWLTNCEIAFLYLEVVNYFI
ncbi:Hypothetical predicted protein [Marmota monax]|uniref:Uncharacterized protein n=1 Tax=Marmota monax TaxID=9995 RepID=A0A5E4BHA8_MARMO|nr:Hypothetical predicted protein [Marmota monax]